jgi:hypothetical protein
MILPTRVVPSNAPPLHDGDGSQHMSRVLQVHSGNRQFNDYSYPTEYEQKFAQPFPNENAYAVHYPQPSLQQQLRQRRRHYYHTPHRIHHPQPYRPHQYFRFSAEEERRNAAEAEYLFSRFRQSDAYVKYRSRQSKDDKGNDDQKWPDHLEKAFFQGAHRSSKRVFKHQTNQRCSSRNMAAHGASEDLAQGEATWP